MGSTLASPLAFRTTGFQEVSLPMHRESPAFFMQFSDPRLYTLIALAMLVVAMGISMAVENGRFGLSLMAIRQNELAAEAAGINARLGKMRAALEQAVDKVKSLPHASLLALFGQSAPAARANPAPALRAVADGFKS